MLAQAIRSAMAASPAFKPATLHRDNQPELDAGGSIIAPGVAATWDVRAQVDVASEAMRSDADFQQGDVRLLLIGGEPVVGDRVTVAGVTYALRTVASDPVGVGSDCRGRRT